MNQCKEQPIENIGIRGFSEAVRGVLRCIPGRALSAVILFLLCLLYIPGSPASDIASNPRTLEWRELVPSDWDPPLIAPAYDGNKDDLVDSGSLVSALNGLLVKLPGFLRPVVYSDRSVTEFLLVPFLPHHIKQHSHLEPNQMVYVVLGKPALIDSPFKPLWVTGTISLHTVVTDEGPAGYKITGAKIQKYDY